MEDGITENPGCHCSQGPSQRQESPDFPFNFQTAGTDSCPLVLQSWPQGFLIHLWVWCLNPPRSLARSALTTVVQHFNCDPASLLSPNYKCTEFSFCCKHTSCVTVHLQVLQTPGHTLWVMVVLVFYSTVIGTGYLVRPNQYMKPAS